MPEAFICDFVRTPIGGYGGALRNIRTDDLAAMAIGALVERNPMLDPQYIDEVFYGCANQAGEDNRNIARIAALLARLPERVPAITLNRLSASGLDAIIAAARAIRTGEIDMAIAGGVESMSRAPFVMLKPEAGFPRHLAMEDSTVNWHFVNSRIQTRYGVDSVAETAENVAKDFGISRSDQDAFALRSQQKAATAIGSGRMAREIMVLADTIDHTGTAQIAADELPLLDARPVRRRIRSVCSILNGILYRTDLLVKHNCFTRFQLCS